MNIQPPISEAKPGTIFSLSASAAGFIQMQQGLEQLAVDPSVEFLNGQRREFDPARVLNFGNNLVRRALASPRAASRNPFQAHETHYLDDLSRDEVSIIGAGLVKVAYEHAQKAWVTKDLLSVEFNTVLAQVAGDAALQLLPDVRLPELPPIPGRG